LHGYLKPASVSFFMLLFSQSEYFLDRTRVLLRTDTASSAVML